MKYVKIVKLSLNVKKLNFQKLSIVYICQKLLKWSEIAKKSFFFLNPRFWTAKKDPRPCCEMLGDIGDT